jgi:hypothetical protein
MLVKNEKKKKKKKKIQNNKKNLSFCFLSVLAIVEIVVDAIQLFYFVSSLLRNLFIHKHSPVKQFIKRSEKALKNNKKQ